MSIISNEHQPGSTVDIDLDADDEAEKLVGTDYLEGQLRTHKGCKDDCPAWKRIARVALAELRTLRARVGELDRTWQTEHALAATFALKAESAEARVKELEDQERADLLHGDCYTRAGELESEARGYQARITDLESQLAAAREEQELEARVREALGERFVTLQPLTWPTGWSANWGEGGKRKHVEADTFTALLRAILEEEAKS